MINEAILITLTVTFLFRILYYAIGEPSHNQNPQAILAGWTSFWANKRLLKSGQEPLESNEVQHKNDCWSLNLNKAMDNFTYELILGICPVCSFWWVSILFIFIPVFNNGIPFLTALFLMSSANILNKILIRWI